MSPVMPAARSWRSALHQPAFRQPLVAASDCAPATSGLPFSSQHATLKLALRQQVKTGLPSPTAWETFVQWHAIGTMDSMSRLGRSAQCLASYRAHRQRVLQRYASMGEYVKAEKMGFPAAPSPAHEGRLVATGPLPGAPAPLTLWTPNEFPYYFEDGVQHDLLWSTHELSPAQIEAAIAQHRPFCEWRWFVNPEALKSIPDVWHVHIISRPLPADGLR